MMRVFSIACGVWCCLLVVAAAEESQATLDDLTAATTANIAAFDNFYCQFDVKIGKALYEGEFKNLTFDHVSGVGHGVWAKKGPIEVYDFRQEGESKWERTNFFAYGPLIYTEGLIRYPGFQLHIKKNAVITSAPNADFHPRMDPLSLHHMVEGDWNTRLSELLARFVLERDSEVGANLRKPDVDFYVTQLNEGKTDQFRVITEDRNLTLQFAAGDYAFPKAVGYSYRKSEGSPWRTWWMHVLETEVVEGVGAFPKKVIVIHPQIAGEQPLQVRNWQGRFTKAPTVAYALLWELKTVECREPTADELTFTADRDLPVMRAGFARVTYVKEKESVTPDQLPGLFESLANKLPKRKNPEGDDEEDAEESQKNEVKP